ncbi:hypothetical protein [Streptomyces sp. AC512_CC834]|uniref:hypothetical protein n=1 Tax=Streptomyces sp. AC512_CC834 TaxID=2823691 RepID=UPI001C25C244|nr:hypothetical protein [Streptomyces sp. AC512_CC834]
MALGNTARSGTASPPTGTAVGVIGLRLSGSAHRVAGGTAVVDAVTGHGRHPATSALGSV